MKTMIATALMTALLCIGGCRQEKSSKDRSHAVDMFNRICELTKEYTDRLKDAPDSADWAAIGIEFEEKLDKISFSYPPDTDLLMTEGQNDTIHSLMQDYVKARGERIHGILHPEPETDSVSVSDSLTSSELNESSVAATGDASRSPGN